MKRVVFVAVLLLAVGCARRGREKAVITYKSAEPAALVESYNANAAKIDTLSADLELTLIFTEEGKRKKHTADAWLDIEKPSKIRLKHDAIGRDLFYVLSDGDRFWICLDRAIAGKADTVYTGTLKSLESEKLLRPDRLLAAFSLGSFPPEGTKDTIHETYDDSYIVSFLGRDPVRVFARATFSREDLRLSRYQVFDEKSRLALDVEYREYKSGSGADVPSVITADWPIEGFSFTAKVRSATIGVKFPPRLWQFEWRKDAAVIDLDKE